MYESRGKYRDDPNDPQYVILAYIKVSYVK